MCLGNNWVVTVSVIFLHAIQAQLRANVFLALEEQELQEVRRMCGRVHILTVQV